MAGWDDSRGARMASRLHKLLGRVADSHKAHPLVERHPGDLRAVAREDRPVLALVPVNSRRVGHAAPGLTSAPVYSGPGPVLQRSEACPWA